MLLFFVVVATVVVQLLSVVASVVVVASSCCMSEFCSKAKLLPLKKIDRKKRQSGGQAVSQAALTCSDPSLTHTNQPHLHTRRTRRIKRRFVVNKLCCLLSGASVAKAKLRQVLPFLHSQKEKGKKKRNCALGKMFGNSSHPLRLQPDLTYECF